MMGPWWFLSLRLTGGQPRSWVWLRDPMGREDDRTEWSLLQNTRILGWVVFYILQAHALSLLSRTIKIVIFLLRLPMDVMKKSQGSVYSYKMKWYINAMKDTLWSEWPNSLAVPHTGPLQHLSVKVTPAPFAAGWLELSQKQGSIWFNLISLKSWFCSGCKQYKRNTWTSTSLPLSPSHKIQPLYPLSCIVPEKFCRWPFHLWPVAKFSCNLALAWMWALMG